MLYRVVCFVVLGALCWVASPLQSAEKKRVALQDDDWHYENSGDEDDDGAALRKAVVRWHDAWIRRDAEACRGVLAQDVLRACQSQAEIQRGRDAVLASLPKEWTAYETDDKGSSALEYSLRHVHAQADRNSALLRYYIDVTGGNRWDFDDTAAFTQVFTRENENAPWRLAFEADAWNLDFDTDTREPGDATFSYDFAMPVKNLARATGFYAKLLGAPEAQTESAAVFEVNGSRFYLVLAEKVAFTHPKDGLPNGWPVISPPDFESAKAAATKAGVTFLEGELSLGGMILVHGYEPGGNLVALARAAELPGKEPAVTPDPAVPGMPAALVAANGRVTQAWALGRVTLFLKECAASVAMLDAAQSRTHGWSVGRKAVRETLLRATAAEDDEAVPAAMPFESIAFSGTQSVQMGRWNVMVSQRVCKGPAPWQRHAEALETRLFDSASAKLVLRFTAAASKSKGFALDFDYSGLPVAEKDWKRSARALHALTGGADRYTDEGWLGFWGERAVLGLFEAEPEKDKIPRPNAASGYLSLWVSDIAKAQALATEMGATFPVIPAINDKAKVDDMPGYRQVYLTDSEGNGIVLTEYTGRSRR